MKNGMAEPNWSGPRTLRNIACVSVLALVSAVAPAANPTKDQAKQMYDRI
ncbi:MAG: hypothetical protein QOG17_695, partial [Gammaproteobacteria bacterium]|nr:hypothetical protein [Gammaproteobacteria bacterium]